MTSILILERDVADGTEICSECRTGLAAGQTYASTIVGWYSDDTPATGIACLACAEPPQWRRAWRRLVDWLQDET